MPTNRTEHERFLEKPEHQKVFDEEKLLVDVSILVAEIMEKQGVSRAQLAQRLGKSKAYVSQVLRGDANMTLRTVADLFSVLECNIEVNAAPKLEEKECGWDLSVDASNWEGGFTQVAHPHSFSAQIDLAKCEPYNRLAF